MAPADLSLKVQAADRFEDRGGGKLTEDRFLIQGRNFPHVVNVEGRVQVYLFRTKNT